MAKKARKSGIPAIRNSAQLLVETAGKRAKALHQQGRYEEALNVCLQAIRMSPGLTQAWTDAAINCLKLERWQQAVGYAEQALARGGRSFALFDALSHGHGALRQWEDVRKYGLMALQLRDQRFGVTPATPHAPPEMPPLPSMQTRDKNIIAFSLFGADSKYCETAVLNVIEQPMIYSHWTCRFYIDDSVPSSVVERLIAAGAQVIQVDEQDLGWPGPMWRFLALQDLHLHRVLFRDADSVISTREAEAVEEWLHSDCRFHCMRDCGTHTELMLAGLWGVVAGALPPLEQLTQSFFSAGVESPHFADQYFLRQYVWPYARQSLLQHDSMFGFMQARTFPGGPMPTDFHVGYAEGSPLFKARTEWADGTPVQWTLLLKQAEQEVVLCRYPGVVKEGLVTAHIPARFARMISSTEAEVRLTRSVERHGGI
ncbi:MULTISPECIES: tetratricopeptide repeat protein [Pseudomonas]|uniref:Tetratricopeptide repeat domain protein n=1 Tax=Pseudomonas chlororaphis O6 TaxID=1037915 RepID=A0AB33X0U9_9PSED|nr:MULTISPECIES: tetratricopeptide repeat protein [Pseudomonas]AZD91806.1 TPR repeat-containing protein [Pseudomonas chlororaphis subsp. aureofaciens]AZE10675.1 TPR repeat-containing protein [Pseudomonas chlororaphis subsp. aureofaciens]AZE16715.1 TPR repeat-containing protein [Pseudomonas chlororaphis subsp. aureofaciens]EIM18655.1 tetratricopeptide repeat domain protein [Pseudomonas chlororaphis O6]KAB0530970.1 tetratricopeptide repeat protein [Pseudomonas chlororaphis subsp. aureofaciens]